MEKKLPKDFFWGGSVSSFQTEGAWDEGGKGLSIYSSSLMVQKYFHITI